MSGSAGILDANETSPEVWAAILHWQGVQYTRSCLASIASLTYPHVRTLLIDNGSLDSAGLVLSREFANVECLALPENLGFAGGFNAGIRFCVQQGAKWIWLLNNDTCVEPDSLSVLVSQAMKNPRAAAFGATVQYDDMGRNNRNDHCGDSGKGMVSGPGQIDFFRAKTYLHPLKEPSNNAAVRCEWLSGSNLLLRGAALSTTEVFDPAYFLYFEDTEFCTRIRQSGWECLFIPAARIHHAGGASTFGERSYWRAYYYTRNRLLFFSKAVSLLQAMPAFCSIAAHLLRHLLVLPFRGSSGRKQLKAEYLGMRDYLLRRFGKAACLDWCEEPHG